MRKIIEFSQIKIKKWVEKYFGLTWERSWATRPWCARRSTVTSPRCARRFEAVHQHFARNMSLRFRGWRPISAVRSGRLHPPIFHHLDHLSLFKCTNNSLSILTKGLINIEKLSIKMNYNLECIYSNSRKVKIQV